MTRNHRLLVVAAIVLLFAVAVVVVVLRTLGGERVRRAVETRLSATLGQQVTIGSIGFQISPLVSLMGRGVRVGGARAQAPGIDIDRVRILPRVSSFWSRPVVIERVELEGFVVSVLRDPGGGWHVPYAVPAPSSEASQGVVIQRVAVTDGRIRVFDESRAGGIAERVGIDAISAEVLVEAAGLRLAPINGRVGRARISGEARTDARAVRLAFSTDAVADEDLPAFLRLLGTDRPLFLHLAGASSASVAVQIDRASARMTGKGLLRSAQVVVDPLRLHQFEAPFLIRSTRLTFDPTTFTMYDGTHGGVVTVDLAPKPPQWTAESRVRGLNTGEFLRALTGRDQRIDGTAVVAGTLNGRIGEPLDRTLRGRAHIIVTNGVVRNFPLLATINRALRLAAQAGGDTQFERLEATLLTASGQFTTDDLVLQARDLRVEAAGRIGMDRSLDLRGHAVVSREAAARGVAAAAELARLRNSSGEIDVPLTISGSLDAPSIGLDLETAIRKGLADEIGRRLRRLIK